MLRQTLLFSLIQKLSDFLQDFTIKVEKTFSRIKIIRSACNSKIATKTDFFLKKQIFPRKPSFFQNETQKIGRVVKTAFYVSEGTF